MKVLLVTPLPEDLHASNIPFNKTYPIGTVFEAWDRLRTIKTKNGAFYLANYEQKHFKILEED